MPDIIHLLPDSLANQIAAGEVVQRPASVVKELMENAIDAGASQIKVIIKDAGKTQIQVMDDGIGMSETDARMCLERHATSKIKSSDDLFSIRTMGFRGEAMASIAAVSQMEIKTRREGTDLGSVIKVEASEVKVQEPAACEKGTGVWVKNLFYNVPARRNFLKSNGVETRHIIEEFQRIALANPDRSFCLYQNDLETYNLPVGKLSQRIVNLFGKNYQAQLTPCKEETTLVKVTGYVGKPSFAKKTRGEQFFFVNQRFIRNNYLNHAVMNAFEGLLSEGSYPFYVLFIEIDPVHIDVNVHPTKTEIKFDDERTIYAIVRSAVKQALGLHNIAPALDFDMNVNLGKELTENRGTGKENDYVRFKQIERDKNLDHWQKLYDESTARLSTEEQHIQTESEGSLTFGSAANTLRQDDPSLTPDREFEKVMFQLHGKYLVTQVKSGMMLIQQQAAHERILYEQFLANMESRSGSSQQCLFPQTLSLNPTDFALVMELEEEIKNLGFLFDVFGKDSIVINGIPADIASGNERALFEGLIEQFKKNKSELSLSVRENLARAMARRSGIKTGQRLGRQEIETLIDKLFACENPNYTPGGQAIFQIMELQKIDNYFK